MDKPRHSVFYICKYCKESFFEPGLLVNHKKKFHRAELVRDRQIQKKSVDVGRPENPDSTSKALPYSNVAVVAPRTVYVLKSSSTSLPIAPSPVPKPSAAVVSATAGNVLGSIIAAQKVSTPTGGNIFIAVSKPTVAVVPAVSISQVPTISPTAPLYSAPIPPVYASAAAHSNNVAFSGANPRFATSTTTIIPNVIIYPVATPKFVPPSVQSSLPMLAPKPSVPAVSISKSVAPTPLTAPKGIDTSDVSTHGGSTWKSATPPAQVPTVAVAPTRAATETEIPSKFPTPSENMEWESNDNGDDRNGNLSTAAGSARSSPDSNSKNASATEEVEGSSKDAASQVDRVRTPRRESDDVVPMRGACPSETCGEGPPTSTTHLLRKQPAKINLSPSAALENPSTSAISNAPPQAESNQVLVIVPNPPVVATSPKSKEPNQGPMMNVPAVPVANSDPGLSSVNPENQENSISEMVQYVGNNTNQSQDSNSNPHRDSSSSEQEIPAQGKVLSCADSSKASEYCQSLIKHQNSSHNNLLAPSQNVVKAKADSVVSSSTAQSWPCSFCHKVFRLRLTLKVHERIHTGERPFKCSKCPLAFTKSHLLKEHLRLYKGEKPYSCSHCSKQFRTKSSYRNHVVKVCMESKLSYLSKAQKVKKRLQKNTQHSHSQQPGSHSSKTNGYGNNNNSNNNNFYNKYGRTRRVSLLFLATLKPVEIAPGITQLLNSGIVQYLCNICKTTFDFRVDANKHAAVHVN